MSCNFEFSLKRTWKPKIKARSAIVEDVRSYHVCTELWSNSIDSTARLGANTTEHTSEIELYIILATLENFECGIRHF